MSEVIWICLKIFLFTNLVKYTQNNGTSSNFHTVYKIREIKKIWNTKNNLNKRDNDQYMHGYERTMVYRKIGHFLSINNTFRCGSFLYDRDNFAWYCNDSGLYIIELLGTVFNLFLSYKGPDITQLFPFISFNLNSLQW